MGQISGFNILKSNQHRPARVGEDRNSSSGAVMVSTCSASTGPPGSVRIATSPARPRSRRPPYQHRPARVGEDRNTYMVMLTAMMGERAQHRPARVGEDRNIESTYCCVALRVRVPAPARQGR